MLASCARSRRSSEAHLSGRPRAIAPVHTYRPSEARQGHGASVPGSVPRGKVQDVAVAQYCQRHERNG